MVIRFFSPSIHFLFLLAASVTLLARNPPLTGHVEAWGKNVFGQASPPSRDNVVSVAAGAEHSLALLANGTVMGWGDNSAGQTTIPPGLTNVIAIAAGLHSAALKSDGTVVVWGSTLPGVTTVPPGAVDVIALDVSGSIGSHAAFTLALRRDGTVLAWGTDSAPAANVPAGLSGVTAIAAGVNHAVALKADGTIVTWGNTPGGLATPPPGLSSIRAIRAGQHLSIAVKSDGTVARWGEGPPLGLPSGLTNVVDLQLGLSHAVALKADGTVLVWGTISDGQQALAAVAPPGVQGVFAIAAGDNHDLYATPQPLIVSITPPVRAGIGDTVQFAVNALGPQLTYQWYHESNLLPGQTQASLTLSNVGVNHVGEYSVLVSNQYGSKLSLPTSLSFPPPIITRQPQSATAHRGESVNFDVIVEGLSPLTFQWFHAGQPIPNATSAALGVAEIQTRDAGEYSVTIQDAAGVAIQSSKALLTVIDPTLGSATLTPALDTIITPHSNPLGLNSILAGARGNGLVDRALLRFDLSPVPPGVTIQAVQLRISVVKQSRDPAPSIFSLHRVLSPGGETFSEEASSATLINRVALYEFPTTPALLSDLGTWLNDPSLNLGWVLKANEESTARTARHFGSTEGGSPAQLIVTYSLNPPPPELLDPTIEAGHLRFHLHGSAGYIYRLEYREEAGRGTWNTFARIPAGAAADPVSFSVPITTVQRFFRVVAE